MHTQAHTDLIEGLRTKLHFLIDEQCNAAISELSVGSPATGEFKTPTLADGHDPRNKNGVNLTPRGVEILYRMFDEGAGYNRAAKMLNITQAAAKHRKGAWLKAGGKSRIKLRLDIDEN